LEANAKKLSNSEKLIEDIGHMDVGGYCETAQVCINGHVIISTIESSKSSMHEFCEDCGKPTIIIPDCKTHIKGSYRSPNAVVLANYEPPKFCYKCGKPFPWTKAKLDAVRELVEFEDKLTAKEKELFKNSLDDIIA
jgi:hypothetical protein